MSGQQRLCAGPVALRPPVTQDIVDRLRVGLVAEYVTLCGGVADSDEPFTEAQARAWYERAAAEPYGWCIEIRGRCIGTARLHSLDSDNRRARYAIGIFDPEMWGRGYGTLATRGVLRFAFGVLMLHRVDLRVLSDNTRAIACYARCGFRQEGTEREGALIDGNWHDDVMMSILDREYWRLSEMWQV